MPAYFANPLGLLALLAIPAILLIHFLREKSRRVSISTLFLLEQLAPRTPRGQRLHRLQNSLPLWLQLLIALLCAWLLAEPRWVRRESTQRVNVILDDTASMSVSRERVRSGLPERLAEVARAAGRTEWVVRTSGAPDAPLFRGLDLAAAAAALERWQPRAPHHDAERAFALALLEARSGGAVLFVSDRQPAALPAGVTLLAFGEPVANCGFAGVRAWRDADGAHWQALVKNFGASPQERRWWVAASGEPSAQTLALAPGEITTISGKFDDTGRLELRLTPDEFALDDALPLVAPQPKPLLVAIDAPPKTTEALVRLLATVPGARRVTDAATADVIATARPEAVFAGKSAVVFAAGTAPGAKAATSAITAERHPWLAGLSWEGLLSAGPGALAMGASDEALVWQGGKPLIFLRTASGAEGSPSRRDDATNARDERAPRSSRTLFMNFDAETSNAGRLPAFVLMLGRFLADVAAQKTAPFSENFETSQLLADLPDDAEIASPATETARAKARAALRAPTEPGFFQVQLDGKPLVEAAAHFGDPRESDFRECVNVSPSLAPAELVRQENLSGDRFITLWLLAIGAALAGSWAAQAHFRSDEI